MHPDIEAERTEDERAIAFPHRAIIAARRADHGGERALGAKRLLAWQGAALIVQLALALIGGAALALLAALPISGR